jgi:hypothetical protein
MYPGAGRLDIRRKTVSGKANVQVVGCVALAFGLSVLIVVSDLGEPLILNDTPSLAIIKFLLIAWLIQSFMTKLFMISGQLNSDMPLFSIILVFVHVLYYVTNPGYGTFPYTFTASSEPEDTLLRIVRYSWVIVDLYYYWVIRISTIETMEVKTKSVE